MGCKIRKQFTLKQGKEEYLMLTADFGSLQMRLTTQDTSINPSTFGNCDPGLYDIYKSDTECPDAHSNTGRIVFVDSVNGQLYLFERENGETLKLYQDLPIQSLGKKSQDVKVGDVLDGSKVTSISHRSMTTKEFKSFTKEGYIEKWGDKRFAGWRRASKTINFATLFNAGAQTLAKQLENNGYKYDEAMEYLNLTNNINFYNQLLKSKMGKMAPDKVAFLAAATLMLEAYYTGFPGVKERSIREAEFAWKNGYARCWHGPIRPLPEMRYMKRNKDGNVMGADQKMWSGVVSNLKNDAGNSPIQCMEANIAIKTIINACMYTREWGLKSYLWNMVHDSEDWIVYKPELNLVCSLLNACSTWKRQPHVGVDMCMDFEICDPAKGHQKNMYHGGLENPFKIDPIEVALDKWNKEHPEKPLSWHGCIV